MDQWTAEHDSLVEKTARAIVGGLEDELADIASSIRNLLHTELAEVGTDPELLGLIYDAVRGNLDAFLPMVRYGIPVERVEPPTAALEHARRVAQRGGTADSLTRGYRLGHQAIMDIVLREIRTARLDTELGLDVFARITTVSFRFIDRLSHLVLAAHQHERDHWMANQSRLRTLRVRELISGKEVNVDEASAAIRYPLSRYHLAVVVWCRDTADEIEIGFAERFVEDLSSHLGARERSLFIAADRTIGWAWIPLVSADSLAVGRQIREFSAARDDSPFLAVGDVFDGVDGFRRSHRQALIARAAVVASAMPSPSVTLARDPGLMIAARFSDNLGDARIWVHDVLGPLASATDSDERMRETLRMYFQNGSSFKATADQMHLHVNSVKYRVQRAVERRGRPIIDDRLDIEVALLLCHWFDAAVLR